jgi:hypothetical protein
LVRGGCIDDFSEVPTGKVNTARKTREEEAIMITPQHCPGFEQFKHLQSFTCKCPGCNKVNEIFSDEFDKKNKCSSCGEYIDFTKTARVYDWK